MLEPEPSIDVAEFWDRSHRLNRIVSQGTPAH